VHFVFAVLEPAADGFGNYRGRDTRDRRLSCWWIGRTDDLTAPRLRFCVGCAP